MPAVSKPSSSSPTRRAGAPKAKGAVRAKTGCYTCRIRRKKCDERPDRYGSCETCVRLQLQCLGFGEKRPEWLRHSDAVVEIREKIKKHLAAKGMIKGHSGSGPRTVVDQETLSLKPDDHSTSSDSRSNSPFIVPNEIRSQTYGTPVRWQPVSQTDIHGMMNATVMSSDDSTSPGLNGQYQVSTVTPSDSLVSLRLPVERAFTYTYDFSKELTEQDVYDASVFSWYSLADDHERLLSHYQIHVVNSEYLLGGRTTSQVIIESLSDEYVGRAVKLLASVDLHRRTDLSITSIALTSEENQKRLASLDFLLQTTDPTAEGAMAALHVISSILFDGGSGQWETWLDVAHNYVHCRMTHLDSLSDCTPREAHVIKTAIWFDVLAAVTTQREPRLLAYVRRLFNPQKSGIQGLLFNAQDSMMIPMGCDNAVVWALAEISALSQWKQREQNKGTLSVPELVSRANEIEHGLAPVTSLMYTDDEGMLSESRDLTASLFRGAAHIYLRTVVSGDYPHVDDIKEAIQTTMPFLHQLKDMTTCGQNKVPKAVIRSSVFCLFICGVLATSSQDKDVIHSLLEQEKGSGNCGSILNLLKRMWEERRSQRHTAEPVLWRDRLKHYSMLLV